MSWNRKPQKGDPVSFSAELRRRTIDAIEYVELLRHGGGGGNNRIPRDYGVVKIKNESGGALERFEVLGVDGSITAMTPTNALAAWKNQAVLSGVTPTTASHTNKFVVLLQPLADDAIGWAVASGVVPVKINVSYATHNYADVKNSDETMLQSGIGGAAQILWRETGTGEKWALVRIGVPYYGNPYGTFASNTTASPCNITVGTETVSAVLRMTIPSGKKYASGVGCYLGRNADAWEIVSVLGCQVDV
jgi:hypothetical protein